MPWRIVELNCSRHYTMIVYISTKLLLIGMIKNYNRGGFMLAVISLAPLSANILLRGLQNVRKKSSTLSEKIAKGGNNNRAPDRGLCVAGSRADRASRALFRHRRAAMGSLTRPRFRWPPKKTCLKVDPFNRVDQSWHAPSIDPCGTLRLGLHIVHKPPCGIVGVPHQHARATEEKVLGHVALQDIRSVP